MSTRGILWKKRNVEELFAMRLYSMYFMCEKYFDSLESVKVLNRPAGGNNYSYLDNWQNTVMLLDTLSKIPSLKESAKKMYESIPVLLRDRNKFDIDGTTAEKFKEAKNELIAKMSAIIDLYKALNKIDGNFKNGFDIKLPDFTDIKELSNCIKDLEFIINQCPYLKDDNEEIKYGAFDVGSTWLTFFVIGTTATILLTNLSKLVDQAIKLKSHVATVKQQEEVLRAMQVKNETSSEVLDAFKKANKVIVDSCVNDLQNELGELKDGEEVDKVGRSIEKLGHWMNKGLQIYSTIDAAKEVKDLFPKQDDPISLNDNIIKLLGDVTTDDNI